MDNWIKNKLGNKKIGYKKEKIFCIILGMWFDGKFV